MSHAGSHRRLQNLRPQLPAPFLNFNVHLRTYRCAVNKKLSAAFTEEIFRSEIDLPHGCVVGHDGEYNVRKPTHVGNSIDRLAAQFLRKFCSLLNVRIEDRGDLIPEFIQTQSHVRAHATQTNKADSGGFHGSKTITFGIFRALSHLGMVSKGRTLRLHLRVRRYADTPTRRYLILRAIRRESPSVRLRVSRRRA